MVTERIVLTADSGNSWVKEFTFENHEWNPNLALLKRTWLCGYTRISKADLPPNWTESIDYETELNGLDIHGGVTYCKDEGKALVFGIDFLHSFDLDDIRATSPEYVLRKTQEMRQIIFMYSKIYPEYKNADEKTKKIILSKINRDHPK